MACLPMSGSRAVSLGFFFFFFCVPPGPIFFLLPPPPLSRSPLVPRAAFFFFFPSPLARAVPFDPLYALASNLCCYGFWRGRVRGGCLFACLDVAFLGFVGGLPVVPVVLALFFFFLFQLLSPSFSLLGRPRISPMGTPWSGHPLLSRFRSFARFGIFFSTPHRAHQSGPLCSARSQVK